MDKLIIGLIIVIASVTSAAVLAYGRDILAERRSREKEAQYLAIRVVCILDRFIEGCVAVVGDDGTRHGQLDADGIAWSQVRTPDLDFQLDDVNWKSLPPNLMYELLEFPNDIVFANSFINSIHEHGDGSPDYDDFFEERQFQYAEFGMRASKLVSELRKKYGMPARVFDTWNPIEIMMQHKRTIEQIRRDREARHHRILETEKEY